MVYPPSLKVSSPLELAELSPSILPSLSVNNSNVDPAAVLRASLGKHIDTLPCLFPDQYHVMNGGLEGQGSAQTPQFESKQATRQRRKQKEGSSEWPVSLREA